MTAKAKVKKIKVKVKSSAKKRFRKVAGGDKLKHRRTNRGHILTKKSPKRKLQLRSSGCVNKSDMKLVKRTLTQT
jgi:large subunit ribosomal protein L35